MASRKPNPRLLALCLLASSSLCAQEYSFRTFGAVEGLQNLAVRKIYQDRTGFIWVSTENGIYRYDGDRFEPFQASQGMPPNSAATFGDAPDGSLLTGGDFGLYRLSGNRFERIDGPFKAVSWPRGIASDGNGHTWIGTDAGLFQMSSQPAQPGFNFKPIPAPPGTSGPQAHGILVDGDTLWYGCGVQLCRRSPAGTAVFGAEAGVPGVDLLAITKDRGGNIWVRARNSGLFIWPAGQPGFRRPDTPIPAAALNGSPVLDPDGRMLLSSAQGLLVQTAKGWRLIDRRNGLRGAVYSVFKDRQHSLWIGTAGRGLIQWRGYGEWESYSALSGFGNDTVYGILPQQDGSIWLATEGGLLHGLPRDAGFVWKPVPGFETMPVHSLRQGANGDLWIGTETRGAARLNTRTGAVEWFGPAQGLTAQSPYTLRFDTHNQLWAATEAGLFVSAPPYRAFARVAELPATRIWSIAEGSDGVLWAGGADGLFARAGGTWKKFTKADGLSSNVVLALGAGAEGVMWVGYRYGGGIDRVHLQSSGQPGPLVVENGVQRRGASGIVYFLEFDHAGRLWAGTEHGVDMWDGLRWTHYDSNDGLIWDDCDLGGFAQDPDGAIWIGTSGGLSRFKPRPSGAAGAPPDVVFTALRIGPRDISAQPGAAFKSSDGTLVARYSALNATPGSDILFRYRLVGANPQWTETSERELQFVKLAPGAYRLEVEAQDAEGAWSPHSAAFAFQILAPWYLQWWFIALGALLPLAVAALVLRLRHLSARRRERELLRIVDEKTQGLRLANEELLRLSTLDPLTGLANRRIFDQALDQECARVKRNSSAVSLILFDADHFKALNDSSGHQRGDEFLFSLASEIDRVARRRIDVAARIGGEEFALLLPDTEIEHATRIAEAVRQAVVELRLAHPASPIAPWLTVSAGVATASRGQYGSPEELIAAADSALYRAKRSGRNRVEAALPELPAPGPDLPAPSTSAS